MEITYRKLSAADLRATYEIRFSVEENLIHGHQIVYLKKANALEDINQGGGWIALDGSREVGFCMPVFTPEAYIAALYVIPEYQAKGIGGRLLGAAMEWLEKGGAKTVELETDIGSAAVSFYEKKGWIRNGTNPPGVQYLYSYTFP